ncbi:MAG TPA: hypothetical protein VFI70_06205 [Nitrososphaeraceae archaeon]|nr:hypothetical protein [Nitrososphaeraceae archaeon]
MSESVDLSLIRRLKRASQVIKEDGSTINKNCNLSEFRTISFAVE